MELGTYPKKRVPENAKSGTRFSNVYPKREFWVHISYDEGSSFQQLEAMLKQRCR